MIAALKEGSFEGRLTSVSTVPHVRPKVGYVSHCRVWTQQTFHWGQTPDRQSVALATSQAQPEVVDLRRAGVGWRLWLAGHAGEKLPQCVGAECKAQIPTRKTHLHRRRPATHWAAGARACAQELRLLVAYVACRTARHLHLPGCHRSDLVSSHVQGCSAVAEAAESGATSSAGEVLEA